MTTDYEPCCCAALRQAARHVTRAYDEALAPIGLGLNQYAILSGLARSGPTGLQPLADHLVMDRSTLGRLLRPLESRGLVSIGIAAVDRRGRAIALTDAGAALLNTARPFWAIAEGRFKTAFGSEAVPAFRAALRRAATLDLTPIPPAGGPV